MRHTFIAYVEDRPGVLNRVASLFRRRGLNNDSLTVGQTAEPGTSRMTVVLDADDDTAKRVVANLYKLVNVLRVEDITEAKQVVRDLALVKVTIDEKTRAQVLGLGGVVPCPCRRGRRPRRDPRDRRDAGQDRWAGGDLATVRHRRDGAHGSHCHDRRRGALARRGCGLANCSEKETL